jgi:hypothetical protein
MASTKTPTKSQHSEPPSPSSPATIQHRQPHSQTTNLALRRGPGGKGLGTRTAVRHRKIAIDNIRGVTNASIRYEIIFMY